jgi:hypothetical protein
MDSEVPAVICSEVGRSSVKKKEIAMLTRNILLLKVVILLSLSACYAYGQQPEEAAVRKAVGYYIQGHATGDPEYFRKAFSDKATLSWIKEGKLSQRSVADYIAGAPGKSAPDEAKRTRTIEEVSITGNIAVVRIALDSPETHIIDYLSLLKIEGEWKIVSKIFFVQPKAVKS